MALVSRPELPRATDPTQLTIGIHALQAGPGASAESLIASTQHAEALGYSAVWFSDHLTVQRNAIYPPSAYIYETMIAMTWVAAATTSVQLGTSVIVLPMRQPVVVGKQLASLDLLSGGRVIAGVAGGYVEAEFDALGVPFGERGIRTDEGIEVLRTVWSQDPITVTFPVHGLKFDDMRAKPQPSRPIPVWVGGHAPAALRRAVRVGDGWHGALMTLEVTETLVQTVRLLRAQRPDPEFVLSLRVGWDALEDDHDTLLRGIDRLRDLGITHIAPEPRQRTQSDYLRSIDRFATLSSRAGITMTKPADAQDAAASKQVART